MLSLLYQFPTWMQRLYPGVQWRMNTEAKVVYLTFDDGPNVTTTVKMLDMLEKHGVTASFFVNGMHINEESAKVMKRAYDMGCDIENHSYSHLAMSGLSEEELIKEIESTSALIEKYTGEAPQFFRPPYPSKISYTP